MKANQVSLVHNLHNYYIIEKKVFNNKKKTQWLININLIILNKTIINAAVGDVSVLFLYDVIGDFFYKQKIIYIYIYA